MRLVADTGARAMNIKALTFDTGSKALDWHGGLVAALSSIGAVHGLNLDWHQVANDWRRRAMKGMVGRIRPQFNMDNVHRLAAAARAAATASRRGIRRAANRCQRRDSRASVARSVGCDGFRSSSPRYPGRARSGRPTPRRPGQRWRESD